MSKKLIFGIIMAILIIIIGLTFGISSIVKFTRMQILISDVKENILKNNYYLKIQTNYRGETQEIEAFYRDGIGKQKSEEGWYTWTDGKKAYLVDEDKKYLKELSIEDDIQLLVTSTRLISLYPTISNNIFERFFIMGNIENKIKTVKENGNKYTYIELHGKGYTKMFWLEKNTNTLVKSKIEFSNGEQYEFKYEVKYYQTKISDIELPKLDEYTKLEDTTKDIIKEKEFTF